MLKSKRLITGNEMANKFETVLKTFGVTLKELS